MQDFFRRALETHLGGVISVLVSPTLQPVVYGLGVILILWTILLWMYRRKIFLRI
jgi:heparan-alpha-glucosaminide N-acetyltransferase